MFNSAHAVNTDWKAGGDACLDQLEINPGDESKELEHLLEDLRERSGISYWVGSVGLGVCTLNQSHCGEFCEVSAIVMMTANLPTGSFILFPSPDGDAEGMEG